MWRGLIRRNSIGHCPLVRWLREAVCLFQRSTSTKRRAWLGAVAAPVISDVTVGMYSGALQLSKLRSVWVYHCQ